MPSEKRGRDRKTSESGDPGFKHRDDTQSLASACCREIADQSRGGVEDRRAIRAQANLGIARHGGDGNWGDLLIPVIVTQQSHG